MVNGERDDLIHYISKVDFKHETSLFWRLDELTHSLYRVGVGVLYNKGKTQVVVHLEPVGIGEKQLEFPRNLLVFARISTIVVAIQQLVVIYLQRKGFCP